MVWRSMSLHGVGPIFRIKEKMDQYMYRQILEVMEPYADESLPLTWTLMHNNDRKHTKKAVKQWREEKQIRV